ncbi:unnamed protein product [Tenebrio molitor]|nr:unnamed protein product [Tenebrio molitor]
MDMAAVVYQVVDQQRHVFAHANAGFSARDQRCHNNEQKCLDLIWGIQKYLPYLEDRLFLMRSNNKALT